MKLFEIERNDFTDSYYETVLKVFGLAVVTLAKESNYSRQVTVDLGLVGFDLYVCKPTGRSLADVDVDVGVGLRGPKGFKVIPVPHCGVTFDTLVGSLTVSIL